MEKKMSIHEKLSVACGYLEDISKDIIAFVKEHNGFIDTQNYNGDCDNIYAYIIDWVTDEVEEKGVFGIKVNDKKLKHNVMLDKEYFEDAEWYICGLTGDRVLFSQTIISIADSIEQYV